MDVFFATETPTTESGAVVNSVREWTIRRKELDLDQQHNEGPICLKLKPDGTWDPIVVPCE